MVASEIECTKLLNAPAYETYLHKRRVPPLNSHYPKAAGRGIACEKIEKTRPGSEIRLDEAYPGNMGTPHPYVCLVVKKYSLYVYFSMQHLYYSFTILLIGAGLVTFVDVLGSIVSRRLNFRYGYFTLLSFIAYTTTGYLVAEETNSALLTLIVVMLIGFYDAIAGWTISQKLRANFGYSKEFMEKITIAHRIFASNLFSIICGFLGYYLAGR